MFKANPSSLTSAPVAATHPQPDVPSTLLGGLSPAQFMRRHWQKKPLLIRNALPGFKPFLTRQQLFAMAADEAVESRLIVHQAQGWALKHGPLARTALPPIKQPRWTLLIQGVDLHVNAAHELLQRFRFVPDARLDDLMIRRVFAAGQRPAPLAHWPAKRPDVGRGRASQNFEPL